MTIVAFCNPLLDIAVQIKDNVLLEKYQLKANNVILAEEKHAFLIEEITATHADSLEYCAGGAGLNALRVAQLMVSEGTTAIVGSIGKDIFGDILIQKSREDGVTPFLTRESEKPTGRCACLINDHNRSLVAFLDAANDFKPAHLEPAAEAIANASLLYITGFFMAISSSAVEQILRSKSPAAKVIFNLSAPFVCEMYGPRLASILSGSVDYIIGNGDELLAWAQAVQLDVSDERKDDSFDIAFEALSAHFPSAVIIITHGSQPIQVKQPGQPRQSVPVPAVPPEEIVDTTGAGDAFVGGILVALERDFGLDVGLQLGCYLAGHVIRQSGIKLPAKDLLLAHLSRLIKQ